MRVSKPLDRQVKIAWTDLHICHPKRTLSD